MSDKTGEAVGGTLIHVCCAICAAAVAEAMKREGLEFEGYFYNPNIHPLLEFRRRLKSCRVLSQDAGLKITCDEEYGLVEWLRAVVGREEQRCEICYRMRLERTAREAKSRGFESFGTTLLVSTHQRHELIRRLGEEIGERAGVRFLYRDWRGLLELAGTETKGRSLYRQQYCGCVYSEYERFKDTTKHLWRG